MKKFISLFCLGLILLISGASMATLIHDVTELQNMNLDLTDDYELANDIDASATVGWNGGAGFIPVGNWPAPWFTGSFDGKGYTITGLTCNRPNTRYQGLFGYATGVTIQNVTLANCNIVGDTWNGGLVGYFDAGIMSNCHSSGSVRSWGPAGPFLGAKAGGLIGWIYHATVTNCSSSATVQASIEVGGLIGVIEGGTVTNCHASGNVNTDPADPDQSYAGGFAGWITSGAQVRGCCASGNVTARRDMGGFVGAITGATTLVRRCYAIGNAISIGVGWNEYRVGGFVGTADGTGGPGPDGPTIEDCYAKGDAACDPAGDIVGGFVASLTDGANVSRCFAIGSVSGNWAVGCFVGRVFNSPYPTAWYCDIAALKDKATLEANGWDFTNVWQICEPPTYIASYPWLQENDKCEGHVCTPAPPTEEAVIISFTG